MYGGQLLKVYERVYALGLTQSRQDFSLRWCARSADYLRSYTRGRGADMRVSPGTVTVLRMRLAEAAGLLPADLAKQVRALDAVIERDVYVASIIGRRAAW